jgi:hypothetical protein
MDEATFRLPQQSETTPQVHRRPWFSYRFLYYRSAEAQDYGEPGQDYLTFREDGRRLAFALCDGVGQSFYGDVAARFLGDALLAWLWRLPLSGNANRFGEELAAFLATLTRPASEEIARIALPENLPPMTRSVLEQKRAHGGESTFVCGVFDALGGHLTLAWLGDTRLRLWDAEGRECTALLGPNFQPSQRWSTRRGAIGSPPHLHVASTNPNRGREIARLLAYTDGLAQLDPLALPPTSGPLRQVIAASQAAPTSDDLALLDLGIVASVGASGNQAEMPVIHDAGQVASAQPSGISQSSSAPPARRGLPWQRIGGRRGGGPGGSGTR